MAQNVRFFLGTREEYNSILRHNPLALYFCTDTGDLFRGDQCLSDGARVVATANDLPEASLATEGVLYFTLDTRCGYITDTTSNTWLQVIFAPAVDIDMVADEAVNNTAVSVSAVRKLEALVFDKLLSIDNKHTAAFDNYLTKDAVKTIITDAVAPYITKAELAAKDYTTADFVKQQIIEAASNDKKIYLETFYTKPEVDSLIPDTSNFVTKEEIPSVEDFASIDYVDAKFDSIDVPDIDLSLYALKSELPSVDGLASENYVDTKFAEIPEVPTKVSELENDAGYLIEHQSLEDYAKLTDLPDVSNFISEIPAEYITTSELEEKGYITEHQDLSDYALKAEVPSVDGLATEDFVKDELAKISIPEVDLSDYAKLSDIPSHDGLATEDFVRNAIAEAELNDKDVDLSGLATKDDIKDFASISYVDEQIAGIDIPEVNLDDYALKSDIPVVDSFATKDDLADAINAIEHPTQDLSGYATKDDIANFITEVPSEYVTEEELAGKGYLTEHQSLDGKADKEHSHEEYANKEHTHSIVDITDYVTPEIPSVDGLASEEFVINSIAEIKIPEVPIVVSAFTNDAGYLTEHDLTEYAKREELPSIEGLATESFVAESINNIELPSLENYYTKPDVDELIAAAKTSDILFTAPKLVGKAVGGFVVGEDISGLTIAELFAKLLELSDGSVEPDEPGTPDAPQGIVENIIANKLAMYAVNASGELVKDDFSVLTLTETEATAAPTTSGFYQIKDTDGNVIESGYQDLQVESDEVYYVIALPKEVDYDTMIQVQAWDSLNSVWADTGSRKFNMTCDTADVATLCDEAGIDISHIDTSIYTVWACEETPSGSKLRFIINE